jgi:hypothetical protein
LPALAQFRAPLRQRKVRKNKQPPPPRLMSSSRLRMLLPRLAQLRQNHLPPLRAENRHRSGIESRSGVITPRNAPRRTAIAVLSVPVWSGRLQTVASFYDCQAGGSFLSPRTTPIAISRRYRAVGCSFSGRICSRRRRRILQTTTSLTTSDLRGNMPAANVIVSSLARLSAPFRLAVSPRTPAQMRCGKR